MKPSLDAELLLGRKEHVPSPENAARWVKGKTILVTGAGGCIGSQICRKLLTMEPERIIALDINENGICSLLRAKEAKGRAISAEIASVCDAEELHSIFLRHRPDIVCHAAAHKHVDLMESSPRQAVKNNIFGTQNVICASLASGCGQFILISTDKALSPIGVMGQTKRICELITQAANGRMKCSSVRFGNVLGSSGSVLPLFFEQLESGEPLTVTDEKATRYFMTVNEAAALVLEAGAKAIGGEVFSLAMGTPIAIGELAERAALAAGKSLSEVRLERIGLRAGERLREEPLVDESVPCGSIISAPQTKVSPLAADRLLLELHTAMQKSDMILRRELRCLSNFEDGADFGAKQTAAG